MQPPTIWHHQLSRAAGVATLQLSGELDLACAATLQALLFEQIQSPEVAEVRVDLAEVGFLDSSALGALVSVLHHAREEGRGFGVINPSPAARRVLQLTGLEEVLTAG